MKKKKLTYGLLGISAAVIAVAAVSWTHMQDTDGLNKVAPASGTATTTQPVAAAPTVAPQSPAAPTPPAAAVTAPQAPTASAPVQPTAQPATTPAVPQTGTAAPAGKPGEVPEDLKSAMSGGDFQKKLSFPLTEEKMQAFVAASLKVQNINNKYDVQIASAQTDQMAIEYNNFAVEEISAAMKSMQHLTLEEYNALTQLTINDKEFNTIYQVYKQLAQESRNAAKAVAPASVAGNPPAAAAKSSATAAAPANPGTSPTPQGSPTPPGSQPVSR